MSLPVRIVLWVLIVAGLFFGMDDLLFPLTPIAPFFGVLALAGDVYLIKVQVQRR